MHAMFHARSSAKKFGGVPEDYLKFHEWLDESRNHLSDVRHRALRHHSQGIELLQDRFGRYFTNSSGKIIPVQHIGEQHVIEDLGIIPSFADWMRLMPLQRWMSQPGRYNTTIKL